MSNTADRRGSSAPHPIAQHHSSTRTASFVSWRTWMTKTCRRLLCWRRQARLRRARRRSRIAKEWPLLSRFSRPLDRPCATFVLTNLLMPAPMQKCISGLCGRPFATISTFGTRLRNLTRCGKPFAWDACIQEVWLFALLYSFIFLFIYFIKFLLLGPFAHQELQFLYSTGRLLAYHFKVHFEYCCSTCSDEDHDSRVARFKSTWLGAVDHYVDKWESKWMAKYLLTVEASMLTCLFLYLLCWRIRFQEEAQKIEEGNQGKFCRSNQRRLGWISSTNFEGLWVFCVQSAHVWKWVLPWTLQPVLWERICLFIRFIRDEETIRLPWLEWADAKESAGPGGFWAPRLAKKIVEFTSRCSDWLNSTWPRGFDENRSFF